MVGFRDISLPLPASAADPFLLDLCRRCLNKVPQARPPFSQIVSELDQHYGPPAWSAHAQPLLPPTLRLPLPAAAALQAAGSHEQQQAAAPGASASAGGSPRQQQAVAAATTALALQADRQPDESRAGSDAVEVVDAAGPGCSSEPGPPAAAVLGSTAVVTQHDPQGASSGGAATTTTAVPANLFSPFGGAAELPPWSVESVASLAAAPAHRNQDGAAKPPAGAAASRPHVLRHASSSDTSSSSSSGAAAGQHSAAGGLGGQLGSSTAVNTQPASASSAAVLAMQSCMAPAGSAPAAVAAAAAGSDKAVAAAGTAGKCQEQEQWQIGLDTASRAAAMAENSSPGVLQAGACQQGDAAGVRSSRGGGRDSTPFEEVQFPAGHAHVYLTPLKVGTGFQGQVLADAASAAATAQSAAVPAAVHAGAADAAGGRPNPFAEVADQPLGSSSSSGSSVEHPPAQGSSQAAGQQRSRQLDFSAAPGVSGEVAARDSGTAGQLPAALQERLQALAQAAPAAAGAGRLVRFPGPSAASATAAGEGGRPGLVLPGRNGPVSAPSAPGHAPGHAQPGEALHLPLDAAAGGSWTHAHSMTALGSSNLPSDGSFMRSLWPSMTTATDPSMHSMALPGALLGSPCQHHSSGNASSSYASRQDSPSVGGAGGNSGPDARSAAVHQQQRSLLEQLLSPEQQQVPQQQQQEVYQVWPVLLAADPPNCEELLMQQQHQQQPPVQASHALERSLQHADQQQPERQAEQQLQQAVLQPKGSGQHSSVGSTSFQRKGRFMVSTMTPEPPAIWDTADHADAGPTVSAAGADAVAASGAHAAADSSLGLHAASVHWGPFGAVLQPGWPLLGGCVSAPLPGVEAAAQQLLLQQQQQLAMSMQPSSSGLLFTQLSAPAKLGAAASQPGTPSTTPAAMTPVLSAAGIAPAFAGAAAAQGPVGDAQVGLAAAGALQGRMSEPACRRLATEGYWGSGIMREPSGAVLSDSGGSRSLRCSHEGVDRCTAAVSLSPRALLLAAGSGQQQTLGGGSSSSQALASMLQQASNSATGGLCYRSGRFHVTVEQLQAWQQRQQELQQQHLHLPHKSNSTGALLAAASMAAAAEPAAAADVPCEGARVSSLPHEQQQQQPPAQLQRQLSKPLHASSSCSSLQAASTQLQPNAQPGGPAAAVQPKQHRRVSTPSAGGAPGAGQTAASQGGRIGEQSSHADDSGTDTKRPCDLQPSSSTASSTCSPSSSSSAAGRSLAAAHQQGGSSTSCLKLKAPAAAAAAKAPGVGSTVAHGRPPVVPSKTPSPAATPCLSPKLQRAKSRDYCKGRFQVHESPVASHVRPDQQAVFDAASAAAAGGGAQAQGPSRSICVAELQHLQKQALTQLPELGHGKGPPRQPRASSPSGFAPVPSVAVPADQRLQVGPSGPVGSPGGRAAVAQLPNAVAPKPRSAGSSPLLLKARARTAGSSSGGGGSSGCLSDGGSCVAASITPTAAAAIAAVASSSDVQVTGSDDGKAGAAAAAVAVQQRGRFTVRQESRPSSRPASAHGSKAGSPRASSHHTGLSKLGSK